MHQGWPAGSFITTRGLQRAFDRRDDVERTVRIAAAELDRLPDDLDFVFVEGFPGRRRWQQLNQLTTPKFFWWLSTNFGRMTPERLALSSFDHVFGNSRAGIEALERADDQKSASFLPLAFDAEMAERAQPQDMYRCDVTYLGISGHKSRAQLRTILQPATEFDFQLWGKGWRFSRFRGFHKGLLPKDDIPRLYASAGVVLGMTERRQQDQGMINNRVFEALGCGATFVADHFPALEAFFGERVHYARSADDTRSVIEAARARPREYRERGRANQQWILEKHTYDLRAREVIRVFRGQGR